MLGAYAARSRDATCLRAFPSLRYAPPALLDALIVSRSSAEATIFVSITNRLEKWRPIADGLRHAKVGGNNNRVQN